MNPTDNPWDQFQRIDNQEQQQPTNDIPMPPPPAPPMQEGNSPWDQFQRVDAPAAPAQPQQNPWDQFQQVDARPQRNFQNIYQDPQLIRTAQEFYRNRDNVQLGEQEAVDRFISDRTWRDANTMSIARELGEVASMDDAQKQRLAYLRQYWDSLPAFWDTGGRGLRGLAHNVVAGTLDPINVVGGIAGKALGRGLGTLGQMGITAGVDAAISAGGNLAAQQVERNVGMRDNLSLGQAAVAGAVGAGVSGAGSYLATRFGGHQAANTGNIILDTQRNMKIGQGQTPNVPIVERSINFLRNVKNRAAESLLDRYATAARIQREVTGLDVSPRALRDATANLNPTDADPINQVGYQARMLASSGGRVEDFMLHGAVLPPERNAPVGQNEFQIRQAPALREVLDTLEDPTQERNFFMYLAALRARFIRDVRNPHEVTKAVNEEAARLANTNIPQNQVQAYLDRAAARARIPTFFDDAQAFLDAGLARTPQEAEQFAARSIDEWINWGNAQGGFIQAKDKWKQLMEAAAQYSRIRNLTTQQDIDNMMGRHMANPNNIENVYVPFYPELNSTATGTVSRGGNLNQIPIRAAMSGSTGNRQDFLESTVGYLFRSIYSGDRNNFKLTLYDTIEEGVRRGVYQPGQIAERVRINPRQLLAQFYSDPKAADMLRAAGINTPVQATPTEEILRVIAMNSWKAMEGTDIVFRNGKLEAWRVNDPAVWEMLTPHFSENDWAATALNVANGLSRWRAAFITSNPVFATKNAVRDTFSSWINSPLGFKPVISTIKGVGTIMRSDPTNPSPAARAYRQMLADGAGYTTRVRNAEARGALDLANSSANMNPAQRFYTDSINFVRGAFLNRGVMGYMDLINTLEMASRAAEYTAARKLGMSGQAAAYMAREVATDFGQRGNSRALGLFLNSTSFMNAGIQGFRKVYEILRTDPKRALLPIMVLAVGDFLMHTFNADHPDYRDIPAVVRAQNVMVPIPVNPSEYLAWQAGTQTQFTWRDGQVRNYPEIARYVPFPKPFDFGGIGTTLNGIYDAIRTNNGDHVANALQRAVLQSIPGFNLPDVVQPFWQLRQNEDWRGQPITPRHMIERGVAGTQQYTDRTPEWARDASQSLANLVSMFQAEGKEQRTLATPIEIEFLANFLMPGLLNVVPQVATELSRSGASGERPTPRGDEFDLYNPTTWLTRAWQIETPGRASETLQRFYDLKQRVDALVATNNLTFRDFARATNLPENGYSSQEMLEAVGWSSSLRDAADTIRIFSDQMRQVTADPTLTADQKALELRNLLQQRNETARNIMLLIHQSDFSNVLRSSWFNNPSNDVVRE